MSLFDKYSAIAERLQDREEAKDLPVKRPIVPLQCTDCWAEWEGLCFAKIRGKSCVTAIKECEYQDKAHNKHRSAQVH